MRGLLSAIAARGALHAFEDAQSGLVLTYADLAQRIGGAQAFLATMGVGPGDRVLARLPTTPDALVLMLACATMGADYAPLSMHASAQEATEFLSVVRPKLVAQPSLGIDPAAEALAGAENSVRIPCDSDLTWAGEAVAKDNGPGGVWLRVPAALATRRKHCGSVSARFSPAPKP